MKYAIVLLLGVGVGAVGQVYVRPHWLKHPVPVPKCYHVGAQGDQYIDKCSEWLVPPEATVPLNGPSTILELPKK